MEGSDDLYRRSSQYQKQGYVGILISGGSDSDGRVPVEEYLNCIKKIKRDTDLKINLHTGMQIGGIEADIKDSGVDVVSYDIIGSDDTIKHVHGINISTNDLIENYNSMLSHGIKVIPHITVGIHGGRLKGEFHALDLISDSKIIVINSLIPSKGFGRRVSSEDILSVVKYALNEHAMDVVLGCMRERGRHEMEIEAIEKGVSGIVMPSKRTVGLSKGRDISWKDGCCAVHW